MQLALAELLTECSRFHQTLYFIANVRGRKTSKALSRSSLPRRFLHARSEIDPLPLEKGIQNILLRFVMPVERRRRNTYAARNIRLGCGFVSALQEQLRCYIKDPVAGRWQRSILTLGRSVCRRA